MIVGRTVEPCGVTDGRIDRITITKTAQRIASRGKNSLFSQSQLQLGLFNALARRNPSEFVDETYPAKK